jgi:hypothetical protein
VRAHMAMLLGAILGGSLTAGANAQVVKPTNPPPAAGRLPAPAKISAAQQPDGTIRVVWTAVEGATRYVLTRSVPPTPASAVTRSNPSDTVYVDTDVKPGSYYYYVVKADNEDQVGGMNASAPPVKAESRVVVDTVKPPTDSVVAPSITLPAPRNVSVRMNVYPQLMLSWTPAEGTRGFIIERAEVTSAGPSAWQPLSGSVEDCGITSCGRSDYIGQLPQGIRIVYRITAVDTVKKARSEPALSNEMTTPVFKLLPPVKGLVLSLPIDGTGNFYPLDDRGVRPLNLSNTRWVSLNESAVMVNPDGKAQGRSPGTAYVVATGLTPDGAVQSVIYVITAYQR